MAITIATMRAACNTALGNQDFTTVNLSGLTPKAAFFTITYATADGVARVNAVFGMGAATGTSNRWAMAGRAEDAQGTTDTSRRGTTDECIQSIFPTDGLVDGEADFVSFIPNGIRVNWGNALAFAQLIEITFFAGTDLTALVGAFTPATQNNTVDINTVGFEPDVILTACNGRILNDTSDVGLFLSHGCAVNDGSDTQRCWIANSRTGLGTSQVQSVISDIYASGQLSGGGGFLWTVEIGGFDADGFSATSRLGNPGTDQVGYLALNFGGGADFWLGSVATPVAGGNQSVVSPDFTPQYVRCGVTQMPLYNTHYTDANAGSLGISSFDALSEFCNSWQDEDAQGTSDTQSLSDNSAVNLPDDDGTIAHVAVFVSFDTLGWTWNFTSTEGVAVQYWALAIGETRTRVSTPIVRIPSHHQSTNLSIGVFKPTIGAGSYVPRGTLVDDSIAFRLNSYTHTIKAVGGYWSMSFTVNDRLDKLEDWLDRLGHHVEVYSPALVKIWEGFIVNASPNIGGLSIQRGPLSEIANRVAAVFSTVDTSTQPPTIGFREKTGTVNDTDSQAIYGIIEKNLSLGGATQATAQQVRDVWLAENALPTTGQSFNSNSGATDPGITIDCLGYVWFLNFYIYNQTANTGTRDISDIIQDVLTADPNGLFSTDFAGISANTFEVKRFVNNDNTAWNYIKSLVSKGDVNDNRYTFGIFADRKATYSAIPTDFTYVQNLGDPKQRIESLSGVEIKPWELLSSRYLLLSDFLIGRTIPASIREDSRAIFLESVTYNAPWSVSYTGSKIASLDAKLAKLGLGGVG